MQNIIGLKELRENVGKYAKQVASGKSFIVVKQSKPIFQISPVSELLLEDAGWETVIDFTDKGKKSGVEVGKFIKMLKNKRSRKTTGKDK